MLQASKGYQSNQEELDELWQSCGNAVYSITEREKQLGMKNMVHVLINCRVYLKGGLHLSMKKY